MSAVAERPASLLPNAADDAVEVSPATAVASREGGGASPGEDNQPYAYRASHVFSSGKDAMMVRNALAVDPELRPKQVTKRLTVEGSTLLISLTATDVRTLRAAVGSFYDLLRLATQTLEAFGPALQRC